MKGKFGIFLAGGFLVLSTIAAATGNFAVRLEQAARLELPPVQRPGQPAPVQTANRTPPAPAAQTPQRPSQIGLDRIVLTQSAAAGFRQFQARSNVIAPGTPFNIYFEPTGLATRFEAGAVRAAMSVDVLVRDAQGRTVATRDNAWQLPIARAATGPAPLTQVYGDLMLNHLTFPDGRYQIVLRIHDDVGSTFVDRTIDIELRGTPGQRVSQAVPTPAR